MERLTRTAEEFDYCRDFCAAKCAYTEGQIYEKCLDAMLYERLRDYEDAEAEGRLLVLPCKVGQEVFRIRPGHCEYREQDMCCAYCDGWDYECPDYEANMELELGRFTLADCLEFGKTVFLTREEAEAALKEADNG